MPSPFSSGTITVPQVNAPQPGDNFESSVVNPTPATHYAPNTVGGTSGGGSNDGGNVLSVNMGGSNFNYDIGPNTDYFAQQAYNYLGNSFNEDQALLGNTIAGSQNFLADFAAPLENFNTQVLPTMFGTLSNQNYALGSQAVQAESNVAEASVQASAASAQEANSASSGGGGLCFITTATCEVSGELDDGPTLTALRGFRQRYMHSTPALRRLVDLYRSVAPQMLSALRDRCDYKEILTRIFTVYIVPAKAAIELGQDREALLIYTKMLCDLRMVLRI